MALDALSELYSVLEKEKITPLETSTIVSCHLRVWSISGLASSVVAGLTLQVAKRLIKPTVLGRLGRLGLTAGAAIVSFSAAWELADYTTGVSCIDQILRQDPTRMQKELVNVLVKSNQGEAWRWNLMSKYFYPEAVYGDEGDKPQMRWRRRSTFTELAASYDDGNEVKPQMNNSGLPNHLNQSVSQGSDASKTKPNLQNSSGNQMVEENALDIIFGGSEPTESIPATIKPKVSVRMQTRKQKRAKRRQRIKNREASNNSPQYELA